MYQVSENFINEISKYSRTFRARLISGSDVLFHEINSIGIYSGSCGADLFSIGSVFASYADISLARTDIALVGREFLIEIGLVIEADIEYVPMGYFTVENDLDISRDNITLKAVDRLSARCGERYMPTITFPATLSEVVSDISFQVGIAIETDMDLSGIIEKTMSGLIYRDALGYIAGLLGGFCYCDKAGKIKISEYPTSASLQVNKDRCFEDLRETERAYEVKSLTVSVSDETTDENGNTVDEIVYQSSKEVGISVSNPYMTETLFKTVEEKIIGYTFHTGNAEFLGDPRLTPEDAIGVLDGEKEILFLPCMSIEQYFDGGLTTAVTTPAKESNTSVQGTISKALNKVQESIAAERAARKIAVDALANRLSTSAGLYITKEEQGDGSTIYYMHNKTNLSDSDIIWKLTGEAFGISTDGGKTYPYGFDISGTAILERIYTVGLNADHITTGTLTAKDSDGNIVFTLNTETGEMIMKASSVTTTSGKTAQEEIDAVKDSVDNIEIGGRNLLLDGKDTSLFFCSYGDNPIGGVEYYNFTNPRNVEGYTLENCHRIQHKKGYTGDYRYTESKILAPGGADINGKTYTFTVWVLVRNGDDVLPINVLIGRNDDTDYSNARIEVKRDVYTRLVLTKTFDTSSGGTSVRIRLQPNTNSSDADIYVNLAKLEEGNKTSRWTPAPEEQEHEVQKEAEEIRQEMVEQSTSIINNCEKILMSALKSYATTGDFDSFKQITESQLALLSNQLNVKITETLQEITKVDGDLQEKFNTITKYFTFDINGLTIGKVDSPFKVVIDNDVYRMLVNGVDALTLTPEGLSEIPELRVTKRLELFDFAITEERYGYNEPTSHIYEVQAVDYRDGYQYHCVITDGSGNSVTTEPATLYIGEAGAIVISGQPANQTVELDEIATFTVVATGSGLTYQWQWSSDDGGTWTDSSNKTEGYNAATVKIQAVDFRDGYQYRCVITDGNGNSVTTGTATLKVGETGAIVITNQPSDQTVELDEVATFTVAVEGTGLSYQWQWSKDNGQTWTNSTSTSTGRSYRIINCDYVGSDYIGEDE